MSPIDPYLGAQAPAQDFIKGFLDREIPAGLLFYAPFWPQTGNQAWGADKRIVVPTTETVDADGTYFSKDELVRRARANALRMEGLGGLIEGAKTNVCLRSEQFDVNGAGVPWTHGRCSVSADALLAPDGAITADKIVEDNTNGQHLVGQAVANAAYTWSVFAKAGERTWIALWMGGSGVGRFFDLANGVLGGIGTWGAPDDSGIERYPNGWFRCWIREAVNSNSIYVLLATGDGGNTYLGDGASGVYAWGGQAEVSTFPSSYIPTAAATVARARENIQYSNAAQVHCQAAAGTFICGVTTISPVNGAYLTDTYDAGTNSGFLFTIQVGVWRFSVYSGGALVANLNSTTGPTAGETQILAACWQVNDFRLYVNGVLEASDVAGAAPTGINNILYIGQDRASISIPLWGNLSHWCYYSRALTGDEIEQRSRFIRNEMARAS